MYVYTLRMVIFIGTCALLESTRGETSTTSVGVLVQQTDDVECRIMRLELCAGRQREGAERGGRERWILPFCSNQPTTADTKLAGTGQRVQTAVGTMWCKTNCELLLHSLLQYYWHVSRSYGAVLRPLFYRAFRSLVHFGLVNVFLRSCYQIAWAEWQL